MEGLRGASVQAEFKSGARRPLRRVAALRLQNLFVLILIKLRGGEAVSILNSSSVS
jgi:hypothetical protein